MLKVVITYPKNCRSSRIIMRNNLSEKTPTSKTVLKLDDIIKASKISNQNIHGRKN